MKITCDRMELLEALSGVSRAVSPKSSIPAIEGIHFKSENDSITLTAYDLDLGIITSVIASVEEPGEIVINSRLLIDMVRRIDSDTVTIKTDPSLKITVTGGITKFNFIGISASDFPEMPIPDTEETFSIESSSLKKMIGKTLYAVATDTQKPVHTGIKFIIEDRVLTMVSVDGYRMAVCRNEGISDSIDKSFIVPGKTMNELNKLLNDRDSKVLINTAKRSAVFKLDGYTMVTRLLEGDFLDYKKALPQGYKTRVKLKVKNLSDSVERASLIINERFKSPVKISFSGNTATVTCNTALGNSYDEIPCEIEGSTVEIGFNNRYLNDALKNSGCEEVFFEISGPTSPMKVLPTEGDDFKFLVLPVRIKNEI